MCFLDCVRRLSSMLSIMLGGYLTPRMLSFFFFFSFGQSANGFASAAPRVGFPAIRFACVASQFGSSHTLVNILRIIHSQLHGRCMCYACTHPNWMELDLVS
jgi:hypothetical protein